MEIHYYKPEQTEGLYFRMKRVYDELSTIKWFREVEVKECWFYDNDRGERVVAYIF